MSFNIDVRLFIYLSIGFVLATVIGTVSHEGGHYIAAKHFHYAAKMHYASVSSSETDTYRRKKFDSLYKADEQKILSEKSSPEKEFFLKFRDSMRYEYKSTFAKKDPLKNA